MNTVRVKFVALCFSCTLTFVPLALGAMTPPAEAQAFLADAGDAIPPPPTATVHDPEPVTQSSTSTSKTQSSSTNPFNANANASTASGAASTTTIVKQTSEQPILKPAVLIQTDQPLTNAVVQYNAKRKRSDRQTSVRMAKYRWLDKAVEADPSLVEAICTHYTGAMALARSPRIGEIAKSDHYTCRRLTKWKTVARTLAKNGECYKVVALDPEGIYRAIKRDRKLAKLLSTNPMFSQMVDENPDLGRLLSLYM